MKEALTNHIGYYLLDGVLIKGEAIPELHAIYYYFRKDGRWNVIDPDSAREIEPLLESVSEKEVMVRMI